ncbi:aspartic peptidase domain-containing protein [Crucibulum laeve]|uniref:Aspartic peptidase domain-containing protein n=1 Tax=Crucibulum laeve TaxID=68775 RepID=A0A5C3MHW1_9AGAR|nr:aspartic peptidase domain-containing protein [Crucibulum laeve]
MGYLLPALAYLILLGSFVAAFHFDAKEHAPYPVDPLRHLHPAGQQLNLRAPKSKGVFLNNSVDLGYYVDITLGGKPFTVLIDTGSSDLWISGRVENSTDTGTRSGVTYAVGGVEGPVKTALLQFGGFTIPNQAFMEIPSDDKSKEGTGIIGLGPNSGSFIYRQLESITGAPVLDRIFHQNTTTPNYFTILLGRDQDPTDFFSGSITVGEILDQYSDILREPKVQMTDVPSYQSGDQHLQILLDKDGIIAPDGSRISIQTSVKHAATEQATVVLDCGFSLPQVPRAVSDAIYGRFEGAEYVTIDKVGGTWIVPCDQEVNVTFLFSGKEYRIHPLDMTMEPHLIGLESIKNSKGERSCIGTFQPFSYSRDIINYDMILGMSFMRNVYTLFDYGDFVLGFNTTKDPYIQLLSITNATEAHSDFVTVRLGGLDTTGSKGLIEPKKTNSASSNPRTVYYIIAGVVAFMIILVAIYFIVRARRRSARRR